MKIHAISFGLLLAAVSCQTAGAESATTNEPEKMTTSDAIDAIDFDQHRWKHRLILLFAPGPGDPDHRQMRRALRDAAEGVEDRDLVVYDLYLDQPAEIGGEQLPPGATEAAAERFQVADGKFTYLLIGKDGGVKMRSETAVPLSEIFGTIDAMPMRQREMRED